MIQNSVKMHERIELAQGIVDTTITEMVNAYTSARKTLKDNARAFAKPEYKMVIETLTLMAEHSERGEQSLKATIAEVQNTNKLMLEIIEDLREHHQARETALAAIGENSMLPPELDLDDANTNACLSIAAEREDVARAVCTKVRPPLVGETLHAPSRACDCARATGALLR